MKLLKALAKVLAAAVIGLVLYTAASPIGNYFFSGPPALYAYRPARGTLTYDDGTPLAHGDIRLTFYPLNVPTSTNLSPRAGITVPRKDGAFESVTSLRAGDGLLQARYRVTVTTLAGQPLPPTVIAQEYASFDTSTLELVVDTMPLLLEVPRPPAKRRR